MKTNVHIPLLICPSIEDVPESRRANTYEVKCDGCKKTLLTSQSTLNAVNERLKNEDPESETITVDNFRTLCKVFCMPCAKEFQKEMSKKENTTFETAAPSKEQIKEVIKHLNDLNTL